MNLYINSFFLILIIFISILEKNYILKNPNIGLLQHPTFWIFIISNFYITISLYLKHNKLINDITESTFNKLNENFIKIKKSNKNKILFNMIIIIGFCFFIGNSLQNAKVINKLPFDFWDSKTYIFSYFFTRIYKFYLFILFLPNLIWYSSTLIFSLSKIIIINYDDEKKEINYPIKNYFELNYLCNFGINILIISIIPFITFTSSIYIVHKQFDVTTISTMFITLLYILTLITMYYILINKYRNNIIKYKNKNLKEFNTELSEIHKKILNFQLNDSKNDILEKYLKKEEYIFKAKEQIEKINIYPQIIKAMIVCFSPIIPMLIRLIFELIIKLN